MNSTPSRHINLAFERRPTLPESTPPALAKLIKACWDSEPKKRPVFTKILEALRAIDRASRTGSAGPSSAVARVAANDAARKQHTASPLRKRVVVAPGRDSPQPGGRGRRDTGKSF